MKKEDYEDEIDPMNIDWNQLIILDEWPKNSTRLFVINIYFNTASLRL